MMTAVQQQQQQQHQHQEQHQSSSFIEIRELTERRANEQDEAADYRAVEKMTDGRCPPSPNDDPQMTKKTFDILKEVVS
ncbi:hypothetical protein M0804_008010 [Polistes exclamans]|nr:hypothetical protein M0804_008010 [Polistes exclamans]